MLLVLGVNATYQELSNNQCYVIARYSGKKFERRFTLSSAEIQQLKIDINKELLGNKPQFKLNLNLK